MSQFAQFTDCWSLIKGFTMCLLEEMDAILYWVNITVISSDTYKARCSSLPFHTAKKNLPIRRIRRKGMNEIKLQISYISWLICCSTVQSAWKKGLTHWTNITWNQFTYVHTVNFDFWKKFISGIFWSKLVSAQCKNYRNPLTHFLTKISWKQQVY